jgi:phosphoribosylformylglycinamidine synthase subunit PurL
MIAFDNNPTITQEMVDSHGFSADEYAKVLDALGREPTLTELGIFSVMWSEHCSYKSSRVHLGKFPTKGEKVLQGPGENAGVIDVGDGWAAAFKMESHNHPSFIEPFQGAATGVGGIMRDVFTMGARPVASLNSLRFGRVDHPRTRYLIEGVVGGIGHYGNCMGVPTVGGEITFDPSYDGNILVNAFNLGLLKKDRIFRGYASGIGNPVMYVGAKTGRDGIHGATMASDSFDEGAEKKRPTVQVGDPFKEKLLLEACLELFETDYCVGIQDMGAAGLTSSSFEMADRAGTGLILDLDQVPGRAKDLNPYEMMLSESQERMLLVARQGTEADIIAIFEKWDLDATVCGVVTDTGRVEVRWQGGVVADIPVAPIGEMAPKYNRPSRVPTDLEQRQTLDLEGVVDCVPGEDAGQRLMQIIGAPNIASRRWVYRQYDHMVRTSTVLRPGDADAAVLRLPDSNRGLAMSVDCNPRHVYLDPRRGGAAAIAECTRNLACVGAEPAGTTDCLNFGSPEDPEIMWEFIESIDGLSEACREFKAPIVGGNVSFYNDTAGKGIKPTPSIAVVGTVEDVSRVGGTAFCREGLTIALLGPLESDAGASLAGSAYLADLYSRCSGRPPAIDYTLEKAVQAACRRLVRDGFATAAHDLSEGGLAVALAEMCFGGPGWPQVGADVHVNPAARLDQTLFGEDPSRILIAFEPSALETVRDVCREAGAPLAVLGTTGGTDLRVGMTDGTTLVSVAVDSLKHRHDTGLCDAIGIDSADSV